MIGKHGYVGATIKRITDEAGIAQGTFYLYFESRQALFDTLLPRIGSDMLQFIRDRIQGAGGLIASGDINPDDGHAGGYTT